MLTLPELKYYLSYPDSDKDAFFTSIIQKAISNIESKVKRKFVNREYTEYFNIDSRGYYNYCYEDYYGWNENRSIFLSNYPVISVNNVYQLVDNEYINLFTSPDTIANSTIVNSNIGEVTILKDYYFPYGVNSAKFVYNAGYKFAQLTGTVENDVNSRTVTGTGTLFTTELSVGDNITIGIETRKITAIASNTSLTVDFNFIDVHTTGTLIYINNFPGDLKKFCTELACWIYYQSPQSDRGYLGKTSINQGGQSAVGVSVSEPVWTDIIDNYKTMNV